MGAPLLVGLGVRRLEPGASDTPLLGLVRAPLLVGLGVRRLAVGGRHEPSAREVARVPQLQRARGARVQRRVDVRGGRGEQRVAGLEAEEQRRVVAQGRGAVEDQRRVRERVVEGQQRLVEAAAVAEEARERRVGPEGLVEEARGALGAAAERRQGGGARLRRLALGDELRDDEPRAVALERPDRVVEAHLHEGLRVAHAHGRDDLLPREDGRQLVEALRLDLEDVRREDVRAAEHGLAVHVRGRGHEHQVDAQVGVHSAPLFDGQLAVEDELLEVLERRRRREIGQLGVSELKALVLGDGTTYPIPVQPEGQRTVNRRPVRLKTHMFPFYAAHERVEREPVLEELTAQLQRLRETTKVNMKST